MRVVHLPISCEGCGACCETQGLPPGYTAPVMMTHLPAELRDEILLHLAEERRTGKRRYERGLPCIWYDAETRRCRHYEHRPGTCRRFEIASDGCTQWRAGHGLAPFEITVGNDDEGG
jgi:Fe-S-cluster containining protein